MATQVHAHLMSRCSKARGGTGTSVDTAVATIRTYPIWSTKNGLNTADTSTFDIGYAVLLIAYATIPMQGVRVQRRGRRSRVEWLQNLLTLDGIVHVLQ